MFHSDLSTKQARYSLEALSSEIANCTETAESVLHNKIGYSKYTSTKAVFLFDSFFTPHNKP